MRTIVSLLLIGCCLAGCRTGQEAEIRGELMKWHRLTLVFEGPEVSEMDEVNPFLNYRLDVTFTQGDLSYVVPGFYAADGNAAESSAEAGNKWMARFTPCETGTWEYSVSFRKGADIAVSDDPEGGETAGYFDGQQGSFNIEASDKLLPDNRARGRLEYVGEPYLKYAESGEYFIKVGVDAPENLLGYADFDASTNVFDLRKTWDAHAKDFQPEAGAYTWQEGKGKNLLGAIHYLASEGLNVFSFLTFNVDGDDRNIIPQILKVPATDYERYADVKKNRHSWDSLVHRTRYDVSKLEQWERIFSYAEEKGLFLHFKTHETETDHLMDQGEFGKEGKLYYRELIARFGHHLALNWNLGEENNQPIEEVRKAANYVHGLDPHKHHLVIHTFPNQDDRYAELIGDQSPLTGASLQLSDSAFRDVHPRVLKWRHLSDSTGKRWALAVDEPGKAKYALLPDEEDPEHNLARSQALYGTLFAGGFGVEWYFGYSSPHSDLTCQDFRSRDLFWDQNLHARRFFEEYLPFHEMHPADELTSDPHSYCLAWEDEIYAVYLHAGQETTSIDLGSSGESFTIHWYNPRTGGALQSGSLDTVSANGPVALGLPPSEKEMDWLVLIRSTRDYTRRVVKLWERDEIPFHKSDHALKEELDSEGKRLSQVSEPRLYIYTRKGLKEAGPALMFIPGGGYSKVVIGQEMGRSHAERFLSYGFDVVAILVYRLPDPNIVEEQHKVPLCDAQKALALLHRNAKDWKINAKLIGIAGSSAGGHLTASLANFREDPVAPGVKPGELEQAFNILMYPVISFNEPHRHHGSYRYLLGEREEDQELLDYYSMESQVNDHTPPTLLIHALDDSSVTYHNSLIYMEQLKERGILCDYIELEKGGHGFGFNLNKVDRDWTPELEEWIRKQLDNPN